MFPSVDDPNDLEILVQTVDMDERMKVISHFFFSRGEHAIFFISHSIALYMMTSVSQPFPRSQVSN